MINMLRRFIAPLIALAIGIVLIVLGFVKLSQAKNFPEIEVTVTRVDIQYVTDDDGATREESTVYVAYTVDGKEYNEILNDSPNDVSQGEKLTVRYNPEKPEYVTGITKGGGILSIVFGIVVALLGIGIFVISAIRGR